MEFAEPSINTVIEELEAAGIDEAFVIPLFIAPSGHSLFDIPTILGLYHDGEMVSELRGEGIEICDTDMKLTVGPTLHHGDILKQSMLDRVREMSTDPKNEGVVLLAHGDFATDPVWESICAEVGAFITAETGISNFKYALVEIGQSFLTEGLSAIAAAADESERTLVIGMYVSMGVGRMADNAELKAGMMKFGTDDIIGDKNVQFAERGILPDERVTEWIIERADEWIKDKTSDAETRVGLGEETEGELVAQ
jgi:sirohydrochlorin ferrochelatase